MLLTEGTIIDNRYVIEKYIASGGFGNTYKAFDNRLKGYVAIKELFISSICSRGNNQNVTISNPQNIESFNAHKRRFLREARRLRMLSHPNIVSVTDVVEAYGTAYFVMDYIDGMTLASFPLPLSEDKLRKYLNHLLSALEHIHAQGISHLDIKPSNIMIDSCDNAILIDFGASKLIEHKEDKSLSTNTITAYTPGYAPLEQMSATNSKSLGPHCDIYALGATLYTLLSGKKPPLPNEILLKPLAPLSNVSPQLRNAISRSMEVLFPERLASVAQFRKVLGVDNAETLLGNDSNHNKQPHNTPLTNNPQNNNSLTQKEDSTSTKPYPHANNKTTRFDTSKTAINSQSKTPTNSKKLESSKNRSTSKSTSKKQTDIKNNRIFASICIAFVLFIICIVGVICFTNNIDNTVNNSTTIHSTKKVIKDSSSTKNDDSISTKKNVVIKPNNKNTPKVELKTTSNQTKKQKTTTTIPQQNKSFSNKQNQATTPKNNINQPSNIKNKTAITPKSTPTIVKKDEKNVTKDSKSKAQPSSKNSKKTVVNLPNINNIDNSSNKKVNLPESL